MPEDSIIYQGIKQRDKVLSNAAQFYVEEEPALRENLEQAIIESTTTKEATKLFDIYMSALKERNYAQANEILEELRRLTEVDPADAEGRELLALSLVTTVFLAEKEGNLARADTLLEELRQLNANWPDDSALSKWLAYVLFSTFYNAVKGGNVVHADALLDELHQLSITYPDDAAVRYSLAAGLFNAFNSAAKVENDAKAEALLNELCRLSKKYPDDDAVGKTLAESLVNVIHTGKIDVVRDGILLDELINLLSLYQEKMNQEGIQRVIFACGKGLLILMKLGDTERAQKVMARLESMVPGSMIEFVRPIKLAMDVLALEKEKGDKGREQALAREPEEVRRVVRMLLDQLGKK